MMNKPGILIVDDDPIVAESIAEHLAREGYHTATAGDGDEAMRFLSARTRAGSPPRNGNGNGKSKDTDSAGEEYAVVITDMNMPRCDGMDLLARIRKQQLSVVPIVITGYGKIESAVEAIKAGATDYLTKPLVDDELRMAVEKALRQHQLLAENQNLRSQLNERYGMGNLIGGDYRMQKVYDLVEAVAESKTTVLIDGGSGTGKTMIARAIHTQSSRRAGPCVTFACGSIPETLLESELFGHVRGAFTGADHDKPGKILSADGGTLFIDEINSATPSLQLKLLRVLQERQFEPVGSTKTVDVDVRFVLATNEPLEPLVDNGTFREDLYYRINVVHIDLPLLRERAGDVHMLAEHFLAKYCREMNKIITGFSEPAIEAMRRYAWPGNVRELENAVERAVVLTRRPVIDVADLPETVQSSVNGPAHGVGVGKAPSGEVAEYIPALNDGWTPMALTEALLEPERRILLAALEANGWNRQATAGQLDINRTTLYKKIKQFRLDEPS